MGGGVGCIEPTKGNGRERKNDFHFGSPRPATFVSKIARGVNRDCEPAGERSNFIRGGNNGESKSVEDRPILKNLYYLLM